MVHGREGATSTRANPYLLVAGTGAMVVATVGLFVRASPTLSGLFLVVGAALLVVSVFAPENRAQREAVAPNLDLTPVEHDDRDTPAVAAPPILTET